MFLAKDAETTDSYIASYELRPLNGDTGFLFNSD